MPANLLDWALAAYIGIGAWSGFRRGLLAVVASLGAYVLALAAAVGLSARVLSLGDAAFGLTDALAGWLAREVHLPPQVAALPAEALAGHLDQLQLPAALRAALSGQQGAPGGMTVGQYALHALAHSILTWLAFVAVFLVAHSVIVACAAIWLRRVPPGGAGAWLGLVLGAAERGLVAAVVLAAAAAVVGVSPASPAAQAIAGSRWAQWLLAGVSHLPPGLSRWLVLL